MEFYDSDEEYENQDQLVSQQGGVAALLKVAKVASVAVPGGPAAVQALQEAYAFKRKWNLAVGKMDDLEGIIYNTMQSIYYLVFHYPNIPKFAPSTFISPVIHINIKDTTPPIANVNNPNKINLNIIVVMVPVIVVKTLPCPSLTLVSFAISLISVFI